MWNVSVQSPLDKLQKSNSLPPGKAEFDSEITSLHFSPHCTEILSTHGPGTFSNTDPPAPDEPVWPRPTTSVNSVVVHSYDVKRHIMRPVTTLAVGHKGIRGSALSPNGTKIVMVVPDENKLKVWDTWAKRKDLRRQTSCLVPSIR